MIPALIVPLLTRYDLLEQMLATVDHPIEHLIVIDNGNQMEYVNCPYAKRITLLSMPANLGVAGSWNLGIKCAPFADWWLIANFDITWPAGSLTALTAAASPDALVLSGGEPPWCAFTVGANVIDDVGLFDERLHPAYFEDNDFQRRCVIAGKRVEQTAIGVNHKNSSTLKAGYGPRNNATFADNAEFYGHKVANNDMSWSWSLSRRRELTWD